MAGLIDPNFLTNRPRLLGSAADQAMNFMAPTAPPTYLRTSQYPATQPSRVQVGSTGATATPFSGQVAGTTQALTTPPAFDPGVPLLKPPPWVRDAQAARKWRNAALAAKPPATTPPAAPAFNPDAWAANPWSQSEADAQAAAKQAAANNFVAATKTVAGAAQNANPFFDEKPRDWKKWAETPWSKSEIPVGELETPGIGEKTTEDTLKDLDAINSAEMRALADQMMKYGGLGERDFSKYYKNAWEHAERDINDAFGARGMFGGSEATRALRHSRTDLAAQQSKDEAEFALASLKNDVERLAMAGQIYGNITENDLERWGLKQRWTHGAQELKERRIRGGISDESQAIEAVIDRVMKSHEKMSEEDWKVLSEWLANLPAPYTSTANAEAKAREEAAAALGTAGKIGAGI